MRILLLTDSLGVPRKEVDCKEIWTYRFCEKYSRDNIIFTYLERGLTTNNIDFEFVESFNPDLIVCQLGIVDASRRPVSWKALRIIRNIPLFSGVAHKYLSKNHYRMTKRRNIHYASPQRFSENISRLEALSKKVVFIPIAPPSSYLKGKVYNIDADIDEYNRILHSNNRTVVDGYINVNNPDGIFLEDGHHLNEKGNSLLFVEVEKFFDKWFFSTL